MKIGTQHMYYIKVEGGREGEREGRRDGLISRIDKIG